MRQLFSKRGREVTPEGQRWRQAQSQVGKGQDEQPSLRVSMIAPIQLLLELERGFRVADGGVGPLQKQAIRANNRAEFLLAHVSVIRIEDPIRARADTSLVRSVR